MLNLLYFVPTSVFVCQLYKLAAKCLFSELVSGLYWYPVKANWLALLQIVYYDGQFDDARLNVTLAVSAAQAGAATLNYAEVTRLLKVLILADQK